MVRGALIIAGAILVATAAAIYFSPYQGCLRAHTAELAERSAEAPGEVAIVCAIGR